uniref:C-type lectin domain-containing protein n=1 Tax=Echeneis naucrates TaxID=173247 RepID=A0A665TCE5_ECHNA
MITWKQAHAKLSASIVKTGVGLLGDDLSQSTAWAEGQHSGHCAVIGDDQLWYSDLCSSEYHVYCSSGERVNFHEVKLNWSKAVLYCKDLNYDLAIIMETSRAKSSLGGWIGLYQQAGNNWDWISDGPSDYRNWAPGEPLTADCASFDATTQKWYSKKCSQKLPFLCTLGMNELDGDITK